MADELTEVRKAVGDVAGRLNDGLTAVLGNITIAKMYLNDDTSIVAARKSLSDAEALFPELADLTHHLLDLSDPGS